MSTKCITPQETGVDKLTQEHKQALKEHISNLMEWFKVNFKQWIEHSTRHEWNIMPTESNTELPSVPMCVLVPDPLDNMSLPDLSLIVNLLMTRTL